MKSKQTKKYCANAELCLDIQNLLNVINTIDNDIIEYRTKERSDK